MSAYRKTGRACLRIFLLVLNFSGVGPVEEVHAASLHDRVSTPILNVGAGLRWSQVPESVTLIGETCVDIQFEAADLYSVAFRTTRLSTAPGFLPLGADRSALRTLGRTESMEFQVCKPGSQTFCLTSQTSLGAVTVFVETVQRDDLTDGARRRIGSCDPSKSDPLEIIVEVDP